MIHCIGNSHAHYFTQSHPASIECDKKNNLFNSYSVGPIIAYNFYEHHLPKVCNVLDNINYKDGDYIMFIVGEVDCRWHLPKMINDKNLDIENTIYECVNRYFRSIVKIKNNGYNIIVFGVHPSTNEKHSDNESEPIFGDVIYRNKISKIFNSKLKELSIKENVLYVDIFDFLKDGEFTKMEYFKDYCHLNELSLPYTIQKIKKIINE